MTYCIAFINHLIVRLLPSVFTIVLCIAPATYGYNNILTNFYSVHSVSTSSANVEEQNPIWCRIAHSYQHFNANDTTPRISLWVPPNGRVLIPNNGTSITGTSTSSPDTATTSLDLVHAREWMEYVAYVQNSTFGAYTVIRCERVTNATTMHAHWKVWGLPFHWNRLQESYSTLVSGRVTEDQFRGACNRTDLIMERLLLEADTAITTSTTVALNNTTRNIIILMLTILWTPRRRSILEPSLSTPHIDVYGHVRQIMIPNNPSLPPPSIVAMLAIEPSTCCTTKTLALLPRRYDRMPEAKLSSWCYERRVLEKEFKRVIRIGNDGATSIVVGEVFLTRKRKMQQLSSSDDRICSNSSFIIPQDVELLEGLTTNLFVLYQDGTLRTASNGILHGYIRQLILQQNIKISLHPPLLSEAHQWKEVFVTSSIQLLCPIHAIYTSTSCCCISSTTSTTTITDTTNHTFTKLWEYKSNRQEPRLVDVMYKKLINY
jgi:hypothetical protein